MSELCKPIMPLAPFINQYAEHMEREYIYSFSEKLQEYDDWDEEDCEEKKTPEKPINEVDLGWLLNKLPDGIKPSDVKIEFGYHANSMAYESHWVCFYYEVKVPAKKEEYKEAKKKFNKDMVKYKEEMEEYRKACHQKKIKETEDELEQLKKDGP